jgi:predicted flavoprotein YhiN
MEDLDKLIKALKHLGVTPEQIIRLSPIDRHQIAALIQVEDGEFFINGNLKISEAGVTLGGIFIPY